MKYKHENSLHMKYILFFDSLNLPQIIIWVKLVRKMNYIVHFSRKNETEYINFT